MREVNRQAWKGSKELSKYTNAKGIALALAGTLDQMPTNFKRSDVIRKLGIRTDREISLLTDALYLLKQKKLITWNGASNAWKNMSRA